jgi:hypothetical protein
VVSYTPRSPYPRRKSPRYHWIGAGWAPDDVGKRTFLPPPGLELRPLGLEPGSRYSSDLHIWSREMQRRDQAVHRTLFQYRPAGQMLLLVLSFGSMERGRGICRVTGVGTQKLSMSALCTLRNLCYFLVPWKDKLHC